MAERGFDIATLLPNGVALNIPPFLGSHDQLEPDEVLERDALLRFAFMLNVPLIA